jgi:hypothetical protein
VSKGKCRGVKKPLILVINISWEMDLYFSAVGHDDVARYSWSKKWEYVFGLFRHPRVSAFSGRF